MSVTGNTPQRPTKWWIAAAVLLTAVAVAAAFLLLTPKPTPPSAPPATQTSAPTSTATAASAGGSYCGLKGDPAGATTPLTTPPDNSWELVFGQAVPKSDTHGPGDVSATHRRCFAHTQEGAVIAATTIINQLGSPISRMDTADRSIAKGPGRDVILKAMKTTGNSPKTRTLRPCRLWAFEFSPSAAIKQSLTPPGESRGTTLTPRAPSHGRMVTGRSDLRTMGTPFHDRRRSSP